MPGCRWSTPASDGPRDAGSSYPPSATLLDHCRRVGDERRTMSLLQSIKLVVAPPHPAARPFLIGGAVVAVAGGILPGPWAHAVGVLGLIFVLFCLYFFRDPERPIPPGDEIVVATADGVVDAIEVVEEKEVLHRECIRVSIFLSQ